jgi:hypothetical protein
MGKRFRYGCNASLVKVALAASRAAAPIQLRVGMQPMKAGAAGHTPGREAGCMKRYGDAGCGRSHGHPARPHPRLSLQHAQSTNIGCAPALSWPLLRPYHGREYAVVHHGQWYGDRGVLGKIPGPKDDNRVQAGRG